MPRDRPNRSPLPRPLLLVGLTLLAGCLGGSSPAEPGTEWEVIEEVEFDPSLDIDLSQMTRTPSGLYYQDLVEGEGDMPGPASFVTVTATGWLRTGEVFQPEVSFDFQIGARDVIPGFEEGVREMRPGGKRKLVIPPELGYGGGGNPPAGIPPGAVLVFEVELVSVRF